MSKLTPPGTRVSRPPNRRNVTVHLFLLAMVLYFLVPIWWLVVASTKDAHGLFSGTGGALWFDKNFNLVANLQDLFTYDGC